MKKAGDCKRRRQVLGVSPSHVFVWQKISLIEVKGNFTRQIFSNIEINRAVYLE